MKYLEGMLSNTTSFYVFLGILNLFVFFGVSAIVDMAFDIRAIRDAKSSIEERLVRGKKQIKSLNQDVNKIEKELNLFENEVKMVEGKQNTLETIMGLEIWGSKEAKIFCKAIEEKNPGFKCPNFDIKKKPQVE